MHVRTGERGFETMSMEYQVQENCLTIFLPKEVDHHNAEEVKKSADAIIEKRAYQICHFLTLNRQILWTVRESA